MWGAFFFVAQEVVQSETSGVVVMQAGDCNKGESRECM